MALSPYPGALANSGMYPQFGQGQTASPFFNISNQFAPRNFHDVIKWSRYILTQSPTVAEVIRKHATYPITDFLIDSKNHETKKLYEKILQSLKMKSQLQDIGFDYYTLGNAMVSIYYPIQRNLVCPQCGVQYNARRNKSFQFKKYQFIGTCARCNYGGPFKVKDSKLKSIDDINIIKWAPESISVNHNPITGESEYYYSIPNSVKRRIQLGDRLFVDTVPWGFIEAVRNNQDFKFDSKNIFHLKNISMGSILEGLGMPPLISLYSLVFYQAVLRKANESIATEYLTPLRVAYPQPTGTGVDPVVNMSLQNFVSNMETAFKKHKRDQNHILIAPTPVGYANLGGEGRSLLVSQEIDQAEETILLSLGVSKELLSGTTNWTSSTVGLRLLENTMLSYITQIKELTNWVMGNIANFLNVEKADVNFTPFKLTDDDTSRQILMNLSQQGKASLTSLFESIGLDYTDEIDRMSEEMVAESIKQMETQEEIKMSKFLKAKQMVQDQEDDDTGYQQILEDAQKMVQQLVQMDYGPRRSLLLQLQHSDPVMYAVVAQMLDEYHSSTDYQEQAAQQQAEMAQNTGDGQGAEAGAAASGGSASQSDNQTPPAQGADQ